MTAAAALGRNPGPDPLRFCPRSGGGWRRWEEEEEDVEWAAPSVSVWNKTKCVIVNPTNIDYKSMCLDLPVAETAECRRPAASAAAVAAAAAAAAAAAEATVAVAGRALAPAAAAVESSAAAAAFGDEGAFSPD